MNNHALEIIQECDNWYANRIVEDFHKRKNINDVTQTIARMNFAKRCCADDANLCEIISVVPKKDEKNKEFVEQLLRDNRFHTMYREQLEKVAAAGTVGAYIYLKDATYVKEPGGAVKVKDGTVKINYVDADCIIPLSVENGLVTECAFAGTEKVKGKERTTLVMFTIENEKYVADTRVYDHEGKEIEGMCASIQLGETKPFAIMKNAEVNNLDNMTGYGLPKIYNAIPLFKALDLAYNILYGDIDKGQKMVFLNELLACVKVDENGKKFLSKEQKEMFILLGEKLPSADLLIKEYNPEIRVEDITKLFELILSLLSMSFGYGTKKYTFENGQIKTATEYIGERQDAMQELNKQRKQAVDYICDIVNAAVWFSNNFSKTTLNENIVYTVEFDDSYIEDRVTKLESMRADAISFPDVPWLLYTYLKTKYNLTDKEAQKYITEGSIEEVDELED